MLTKWLTTVPSTVDKTSTAAGIRWSNKTPSNVVSPLYLGIEIPAYSISAFPVGNYPYIAAQLNYTAPRSFTITSYRDVQVSPVGSPFNGIGLVVRHRVGTVVTRYMLWNIGQILPGFGLPFPQYKGQLILSNFCLELWGNFRNTDLIGNPSPVYLQTSTQIFPSNNFGAPSAIQGTLYQHSDLGYNFPYMLPVNVPVASAWLSN